MKAHSTAVDLCQNDVDVVVQLRQLQSNHLLLRAQLTQLQHDAFRRRLLHQKSLYETRAALESQLRQLQLKHNRRWGL
ncbi:uncharacterized protein LOC111604883 [Drosophila hydei]|uniref:Uncharacterized protein LOC111604883 n=1 Tax=Drosophila hydei TaxID=7224 RepID=A0A6J1MIH7_DROHY|nr:uncharacterized protein LOC111604883 [Drosophila hydei]XP_023178890.1 uncharacterized protein LOC111604883 [Drosophila hydei]XP_023178891.1 uncharacterized protein LOC111604883 [Drosophila hydei]